jgi:transcriptional regulator with XRE-family HTH domain
LRWGQGQNELATIYFRVMLEGMSQIGMQHIGAALREARLAAGMTQHALGKLLGVTFPQQFVRQLEVGLRPIPYSKMALLPESIRYAVVQAALEQNQAEADRLRALLNGAKIQA